MVTYDDILRARQASVDFVKKTPLVKFDSDIYLKLENTHEQVGAFKIRGAYNKMLALRTDCKEVMTAAVGSHGFAVGVIGKKLGVKTTCYMPENAPSEKIEKMKELVDEVVVVGVEFSVTEQLATKAARDKNVPFVHPYNDEDVIAGQGTMGLEIAEDMPDVANVYLPVGGGGMLSGVGVALATLAPDCRIVGVQPEVMHAMATSVHSGKITAVAPQQSLAGPLAVNLNPTAVTFPYVQKYAGEFILVSEVEITGAMKKIYEKTGQIVEGAGAIALAAALKDSHRHGPTVCAVSGGNISKVNFTEIIGNKVFLH